MMKRVIFLCIVLGSFTLLYAGSSEKLYDIRSAKITYDIFGGGVLTDESNLTIKSVQKLYMKEWGRVEIEELKRTEILFGALSDRHVQKVLKKYENGTVYSVDFDKEQIVESKSAAKDKRRIDLTSMQKRGEMKIATLSCEVWESKNRKVCLYKGIPLLDEKDFLGLRYVKRARLVYLEPDFSDEVFTLPELPYVKDTFMSPSIKTTKFHESLFIADRIIASQQDIPKTEKKFLELRNELGSDIFRKHKAALPEMLKQMREARVCLYVAEDQSSANECLQSLIIILASFNKTINNEITFWTEESKKKILEHFEDAIGKLEADMPCINRAENISDLSKCMK